MTRRPRYWRSKRADTISRRLQVQTLRDAYDILNAHTEVFANTNDQTIAAMEVIERAFKWLGGKKS